MKFHRSAEVLVACLFACLSITLSLKPEDTEYKLHENRDDPGHEIQRRAIRIYSKPPGENAEIYMGWNPRKHVDNVMQGGKIGLEVDTDRFTRRFSPIYRGIKKLRESRKRKWGERFPLPVDFPEGKSFDDDLKEKSLNDDPKVDFDPRKLFDEKKDWQRLKECENTLDC